MSTGYENIGHHFFIKTISSKRTRGHDVTLVKSKVDWMLESIHSFQTTIMSGINHLLIVYILVALISSRIK